MTTYVPLDVEPFDLLTSSAEASPAKTSLPRASELAFLVLEAAFGLSTGALSMNSDHLGWLSKTWRAGRVSGWTSSASLWNSLDTQLYRSRLAQAIAARPTVAHAFSSSGMLNTLTTKSSHRQQNARGGPRVSLQQQVHLLPTLTAQSYGTNKGGAAGREGQPARRSLRALLPTLTTTRASYMVSRGTFYPMLNGMVDGPMNPTWLEWYMDFPPYWTRL
jgi:hypothetical protein